MGRGELGSPGAWQGREYHVGRGWASAARLYGYVVPFGIDKFYLPGHRGVRDAAPYEGPHLPSE